MKNDRIILVHRKFAIFSEFLDTILQSEDIIQEGETRKDALKRVHKELVETAAELRSESGSSPFEPKYYTTESVPITHTINLQDVRAKEELEDKILAATSPAELAGHIEDAVKYGLSEQYIKKSKELHSC